MYKAISSVSEYEINFRDVLHTFVKLRYIIFPNFCIRCMATITIQQNQSHVKDRATVVPTLSGLEFASRESQSLSSSPNSYNSFACGQGCNFMVLSMSPVARSSRDIAGASSNWNIIGPLFLGNC